MRLFLLPVSTRRTLIYCERVQQQAITSSTVKPPITERIINKAAQTWAQWEKAEKGWQKQVVTGTNTLLKRIPYEEWGLKSIPPATKQRLQDVDEGKLKFECLYPGAFMKEQRASEVLKQLAIERQGHHSRYLWYCVAWMPISAPFTVVPILPNLPFYYLCYRAYSHYKALYGAKLLQHITSKNLVKLTASAQMDEMYAAGLLHPTEQAARETQPPSNNEIEKATKDVETQVQTGGKDVMLLKKWNGALLAEGFNLAEMEIEIERAVEQVGKGIMSEAEKEQQKLPGSQDSAAAAANEVKKG